MLAQVGSSKALRELPEQDEGLEQCLNGWVGKTPLAASCHRSVDGLQGIFAEDTVVARALLVRGIAGIKGNAGHRTSQSLAAIRRP